MNFVLTFIKLLHWHSSRSFAVFPATISLFTFKLIGQCGNPQKIAWIQPIRAQLSYLAVPEQLFSVQRLSL